MWKTIDRMSDPEGFVEKHVFTADSAVVESVLYRYPTYAERTVICCSTQSGCPVGCRFCGAGDFFVRNLTAEEIASQPIHLLDMVEDETGTKATDIASLQIMFMSMGEPMLNQSRLVEALGILRLKYPNAALLVSTSGPDVDYNLFMTAAEQLGNVGLQFSVHESTDAARDLLVPFKKKLSLAQMAKRGEEFFSRTGRTPFFNYCVHEANGTQADADRLLALFRPDIWQATISVISERDETLRAAHERQREVTETFMSLLSDRGYSTRRFDPAGQDTIGGGCGQLHYVQQWAKENPDKARPSVGRGLPIIHSIQVRTEGAPTFKQVCYTGAINELADLL